jgi:hypothetical protein
VDSKPWETIIAYQHDMTDLAPFVFIAIENKVVDENTVDAILHPG